MSESATLNPCFAIASSLPSPPSGRASPAAEARSARTPSGALAPWRSPPGASPSRTSPRSGKKVVPVEIRRSEEHTSELQSQSNLVCRLLLEKKKEENIRDLD